MLPYPVVGGFFAGFGWFIFLIGFKLLFNEKLSLYNILIFLSPSNLIKWVPAIIASLYY